MNRTSCAAWLRTLIEVSLDSENVYVSCAARTQDTELQGFLALEIGQHRSERARLVCARRALGVSLLPVKTSWLTQTFQSTAVGQLTDSAPQEQILRLCELRLGIAIKLYSSAFRTPLPLSVRAVLHDLSARTAARLTILQQRRETSLD
jgi:hypothetical protein